MNTVSGTATASADASLRASDDAVWGLRNRKGRNPECLVEHLGLYERLWAVAAPRSTSAAFCWARFITSRHPRLYLTKLTIVNIASVCARRSLHGCTSQ
ncbi:hypothetical protein PSP6_130184 [Paraburkholderia tropica]|nr:hypothetical protein PSP6_130184 [Paraburkholderia tropica]